jgi:hypothetical protein
MNRHPSEYRDCAPPESVAADFCWWFPRFIRDLLIVGAVVTVWLVAALAAGALLVAAWGAV